MTWNERTICLGFAVRDSLERGDVSRQALDAWLSRVGAPPVADAELPIVEELVAQADARRQAERERMDAAYRELCPYGEPDRTPTPGGLGERLRKALTPRTEPTLF